MRADDLVEDNEGDKGVVTETRIAAGQEQVKVRYDCTGREGGWMTSSFFDNLSERVRDLDAEAEKERHAGFWDRVRALDEERAGPDDGSGKWPILSDDRI